MNALRGTCVLAIALAGISLWLLPAAAQEPDRAPGFRRLISDLTAPAIDRGIRDRDPVREARTSKSEVIDRRRSGGGVYRRGSMIVKFRAGTPPGSQRALLSLVDGTETPDLPYADFDIVGIDAAADPEAAARRLAVQPDVEYAQARYRVQPRFRPNDQFYSLQWNLPLIDMERAWDINQGAASSIIVAVVDSGIAYRTGVFRFSNNIATEINGQLFPPLGTLDVPFAIAPELGNADRFVAPRDFIWEDDNPLDLDGHGTHVAGTIGQLTNNGVGVAGMAFNVKLMPVKVVDNIWDEVFNSPLFGTDDTVARGIRYAADNGAKVINLSIGRTGPPAPAMESAIIYAVSRGAFVSVAAGNDFLDGNPIERPADVAPQIDGMVAVGAIRRSRTRAAYSSTGDYIELVAPGGDSRDGASGSILQQTFDFDLVETYTLGPARFRAPRFDSFAYVFSTGTSMSAPHVSGFAALLMEQGITSPAAVEAIMKQTATDLGTAGRDDEYGHGLVNPRAALRGMGLAK
jgi:serine protease